MRRRATILVASVVTTAGLLALVVTVAGAGGAARAPTYLERATVMDAFNKPGRALSSTCVRIVVSTVDPRYAIVAMPVRPKPVCVRAGEVGDGYALFRRATRTSFRWKSLGRGSDPPCLRFPSLPRAVVRDLFGTSC